MHESPKLEFKIRRLTGGEHSELINLFYQRHASKALVRRDDLFFVAMNETEILGAVRFCIEEEIPMLRSMMIHENFRRHGIGRKLLQEFRRYLEEHSIRETYCIPYSHLVDFYRQIGFELTPESEAPAFLQDRLNEYRLRPTPVVCMKRP